MKKPGTLFVAVAILVSSALRADAQDPSEVVPDYLVPVAVIRLEGAYGSVWKTELWVANTSEQELIVGTHEICPFLCGARRIAPGLISEIPTFPQSGNAPGLLFYTNDGLAPTFYLRAQDLSRQAETWGTQIPVPAVAEMTSAPIYLMDVPMSDEFRQMLRVYFPSTDQTGSVTVSVFSADARTLLGETELTVEGGSPPYKPAYGQMGDLKSLLNGADLPVVTVRITSEQDIPFWAFISVTNNATQHFTTIAP